MLHLGIRAIREMFINNRNIYPLQIVRLKSSISGVFILAILLIVPINQVSADFSTTVTLTYGNYGDFDTLVGLPSDGFKDDIIINMTLELYNKKYSTPIDLYFGITLPSGQEFWWEANLIVYKSSSYASFDLTIVILEIATESGFYTAQAVGFAASEKFSYMTYLVFDPPGSGIGQPPGAFFL